MFDIRKIQEKVIFEAVLSNSDAKTAEEIVYGSGGSAKNEDNAEWVKSTMRRLKDTFDNKKIKCIRMGCQCGYGMDEKLALIKELMSTASNLRNSQIRRKQEWLVCFVKMACLSAIYILLLICNLHSARVLCLPRWIGFIQIHGVSVLPDTVKCFSKKHLAAK